MISSILERLLQPADTAAILNRTRYSIATQHLLAGDWIWAELSLADWEAQLDEVDHGATGWSVRLVESEQDMIRAAAELTLQLTELHDATVTALGVARIRYRRQEESALLFQELSALGRYPEETLAEAERWELAWEEIDPAFVPVAGLTLAAFAARRVATLAAQRAARRTRLRRAQAAARLALALRALNDTAQAWYAEARSVFPPGHARAELLEAVPTTYVPRYAEAAKLRRQAKRATATATAQRPVLRAPAEIRASIPPGL